ncbi:MAG: aminoglycoside phosphotransferase family protein [Pseudomonadales bacterium]|nr:aminoglycoside phosphotransferase family protein [Pseudomonadales bacterium]MBO7005881.1 aminoglycoside phosphotransferase family protein [Pseudomonadales bacterium]
MKTQTLHDNEIPVDGLLVQRLVAAQFPNWSGLPLKQLEASGSSNLLFRLGENYLVRLPRQPGGGRTIVKESTWLPSLKDQLDIRIPEIVALGEPTDQFPETWSIQRWIPGYRVEAGNRNAELAKTLAASINQLRSIPLPRDIDKSLRPYRGRSLQTQNAAFQHNLEACRTIKGLDIDLDAVLQIWNDALLQPEAEYQHWFHSDLVAENLLIDDNGKLAAILDFGGLGIGDPAIDLHGAWEIFSSDARHQFRDLMNVSEAEWQRGKAWALAVPLMTFSYYWHTMPGRVADRMKMLRAVLEE